MTGFLSTEPDPDAIAAAVRACGTVVDLSGGLAGEAATYLPGRRVTGVRIDDRTVTVHVVARYGPSIAEIGAEVSRAVAPLAAGRQVAVAVEDLAMVDEGGSVPGVAVAADPGPALIGRPATGLDH